MGSGEGKPVSLAKKYTSNFHSPCCITYGKCMGMCHSICQGNALLRGQAMDDEGLQTLMCEVEAILNRRPLTKISDDPYYLNALTPNHLLLLRSTASFPSGIFSSADNYSRRRWKQVQYMTDIFRKSWTREYLPSLQVRQKWNFKIQNISKNDLVLVVDHAQPRSQWPLGRITDCNFGRDGLVCSVKVKTSTSELVRPMTKLCLLEASDED